MTTIPRGDFLGLPLAAPTEDELIDYLLSSGPPRAAAYLNAHVVNLAFESRDAARLLRAMDLVYADGMSVVREARRAGLRVPERLSAADYLLRVAWRASAQGKRVALVGGAPGVAERCAKALRREVPGLQVCATAHGYFKDSGAERLGARVASARPDLVLLGMGTPRQERVALAWRAQGVAPVLWCVGALFEYYAGTMPRAPRWMSANGFEWLFRLGAEPRRMARRYLVGNPLFLWRARRGRPAP
ncbi:MAG: WecB/TagA/CpsF family glycosyltransferase [Candidatus Sumerlaeia bacterium]|nr:WecB/TagA/CpsF family glycosyltransferase [Candidatus Sumerlaeia bacterium]